jgi:signal transduction histidine kinase
VPAGVDNPRPLHSSRTFSEVIYQESRLTVVEGIAIAVLAAMVIGLLLAQRRRRVGERELQQRLQLEILISELSWSLGNGDGDSVWRTTGWLRRLAACLDADRVSLLPAASGPAGEHAPAPVPAHSWSCGPAYPAADFPALTELIAHGELVRFSSLEVLPSALARDRQSFKRYGVESILLLPLRDHGSVLGALALAASTRRLWPKPLLERLQFVAGILARAITEHGHTSNGAPANGGANATSNGAPSNGRRGEMPGGGTTELETRLPQHEMARFARVGALGQFAVSLAHELNQPLSAILSNAQAARRFLASPNPPIDEIRAILDDIDADDRRAGEVIRGMRALLNDHDVQMELLDLNEVVRGVVRLLHGDVLMRRVALVLDLESPLPTTCCDPGQIQQVLLNLVLNGFEAMHETSYSNRRLIIRTRAQGDGFCVVSVRDSGRGIGGPDAERLFDQFFSTKPDGLGMGLSIARSIVQGHGGRIWATNNSDVGATFHFTIPIAHPAEAHERVDVSDDVPVSGP